MYNIKICDNNKTDGNGNDNDSDNYNEDDNCDQFDYH